MNCILCDGLMDDTVVVELDAHQECFNHHDSAFGLALSLIEDHRPDAYSDIDDSVWLDCSCGWTSLDKKAGWHEHLVAAFGDESRRMTAAAIKHSKGA